MKTNIKTWWILFLLIISFNALDAHDANQLGHITKLWTLTSPDLKIEASFLMYKQGEVYLEKTDHSVIHYPLGRFTPEQQNWLKSKITNIESLHQSSDQENANSLLMSGWILNAIAVVLFALILLMVFLTLRNQRGLLTSILFILAMMSIFGFKTGELSALLGTDPAFIDKAFDPFKPSVNTFWDDKYFYVESKGIPDHKMMKGITGWQQQVPIPQCYIGNNAWSIPLNPEIATTPVPVNPQHFIRGAVAIAANGVPIFNPYTNTGVDALLDGQLDTFGGHCGRADDYHYHIAPLQLHTLGQTALTNPIAFALDGFAVYGHLEPDGGPMKPLDTNHGHYGPDGVYHYHGTTTAPYMIGKMVGKVTEDNTMQIIPQAAAKPIRPAGTPLQGAVITDCKPNGNNNGYKLEYTKGGQKYAVEYFWTAAGNYTFNFINPTGTTTSIYDGFIQCNVPTYVQDWVSENHIDIFPNPATDQLLIDAGQEYQLKNISRISIYDLKGRLIYDVNHFVNSIDISTFPKGVMLVRIQFQEYQLTKKIINQ